jgi:hypothetical protein|eukprot:COSAG01_NODE_8374_length_2809_cov_15.897786_4_plen_81_part_00
MEAHGSILQSALELLRDEGRAPGESVYVALDAIASRECRRRRAPGHTASISRGRGDRYAGTVTRGAELLGGARVHGARGW